MTENGDIPGRPRPRRAYHQPAPIAFVGNRAHVRLTPPCACGYPLLNTDRECPRCEHETAWASTLPAPQPEEIDADAA